MKSGHLIPRLMVVDEIPRWIIASDVAAYTPNDRTIWIRRGAGRASFLGSLLHEIGHHAIDLLGGGPRAQHAYDAAARRLCP